MCKSKGSVKSNRPLFWHTAAGPVGPTHIWGWCGRGKLWNLIASALRNQPVKFITCLGWKSAPFLLLRKVMAWPWVLADGERGWCRKCGDKHSSFPKDPCKSKCMGTLRAVPYSFALSWALSWRGCSASRSLNISLCQTYLDFQKWPILTLI